MTYKTRIYLDVDGVLNADLSGSKDHWQESATGAAIADGRSYQITWAPELIRRLSALDDVEIVWCTTWRTDATKSLADLLGFGHNFRVLHPDSDPEAELPYMPSIQWKIPAILADLEENPVGGIIHIDDEVVFARQWVTMVSTILGGLAISPHPLYGITRKNMDAIETYIRKRQSMEDE